MRVEFVGGLGGFGRLEDELLDLAGFGRGVAVDMRLIVLLHLFVADRLHVGDRFGIELDVGDLAVFRSSVCRLALLEPGLQRRIGGRLDRLDERARHRQVVDRTIFAAIERHCLEEGVGGRQPVGNRLDDLLANGDLLTIAQIILRRHPDLAQHIVELPAVERAVGALEGRIFARQCRQLVLGDAEPELARLLVENRAGDKLPEHLLIDAEGSRLLAGQAGSQLLRHHLDLPVVGEPIVLERDGGAARHDDMRWRRNR